MTRHACADRYVTVQMAEVYDPALALEGDGRVAHERGHGLADPMERPVRPTRRSSSERRGSDVMVDVPAGGGGPGMAHSGLARRPRAAIATLAAVLCLLAGSTAAAAADGGPSLDATLFAKIDTFLASERQATDIPGLAVVIVDGDRIVHTAALGIADGSGRPVTPDTPFVLASLSKAFTATAVMQLVEAGRIELGAPVRRYVPWFRVADETASASITVAQLLHHTSGLPTVAVTNDDQDGGALERDVRALASVRLLFDPGTGYHYTNADYDVLGFVVQEVSGTAFDRYVQEHIFQPLGMSHSHVLPANAVTDGASEGFYRWFGVLTTPTRVPRPRSEGPAAMMYSSANDMGRWIIANLNGGLVSGARIISAAGMGTLHAPVTQSSDEFHAYAMGWDVRPYWEALVVAGASPVDYPLPALVEHGGAAPSGHTYVGLVPERGWGFAVLMNTFDQADQVPFLHVEQGIQRILAGKEPLPLALDLDPLGRSARATGLLLLLLELVSFWWSVWTFRRWRRPGTRRPAAGRAVVALAAPLLLDVLTLWLLLIEIPARFDTTLPAILAYQPDAPWLVLPLLLLAGIWGPIRTIGLTALYLRPPRAREEPRGYAVEPEPLVPS
jgi:CubicO group peptidase (beta-lactamase class C family)